MGCCPLRRAVKYRECSGIRQITNQTGIDHVSADWGPHGRRLVFERGAPDHVGVALINPDGSGQHDLTPTGIQGQPAFTADGSHIVYERVLHHFTDDSLWVMRRDGTGMRRLTRNPFPGVGGDTDPNVSPDGKVVSFVRTKESSVLQALFSVHLDGTHLRQLTAYSLEVAVKHDWSPDGSHIVLTTNADFVRPGDSANLATVRPDGSGLRYLTRYRGGAINAFAGSYSPDGRWIVYRLEDHGTYALYKIHPDGHGAPHYRGSAGQPAVHRLGQFTGLNSAQLRPHPQISRVLPRPKSIRYASPARPTPPAILPAGLSRGYERPCRTSTGQRRRGARESRISAVRSRAPSTSAAAT